MLDVGLTGSVLTSVNSFNPSIPQSPNPSRHSQILPPRRLSPLDPVAVGVVALKLGR